MEYSAARICLYLLVFLQTFSFLLCASTYLNHGIQGNLEVSVRSPVRKKLLPEIKHKMRTSRSVATNSLKSSQLETLCSYHTTNVLCTVSQVFGDSRLQQSRIKHSISSQDRLRTIDRDILSSVLNNSRRQTSGSSIESLLASDPSTTLEQKLIISQLSNYRPSLADGDLEDILQLERTNHQRQNTDESASITPTTSTSSSTTTNRPTTSSSTSSTAAETTPELPTNRRISTRNSESLSFQSETSRFGNLCIHPRGPYCLNEGECIYDSRLNLSDCVCPLDYTGYRCSKKLLVSPITRLDVSGNDPHHQYGDWTKQWYLNSNSGHRRRHHNRFNRIRLNL